MKSFTPEIKRILRDYGCSFHRYGKGDHEIWWSPLTERHVTVDNCIRSRHLANRILKDAGIEKRF
ncbi:MAG TPA: type II toxin-antitoxin system HicA family toxin [Alphaproteobacteria bacterium]|nr:type II toxin-antitoxin system HicA family toxin [Alphaproteobacteria bacterium]